jgi:hypothetical protein
MNFHQSKKFLTSQILWTGVRSGVRLESVGTVAYSHRSAFAVDLLGKYVPHT